MWHHPKYYKELRKRNKELQAATRDLAGAHSDQAISLRSHDGERERSPGPGLKPQATSYKLPGPRPISNANKGLIHRRQASSGKQQAIEETVPHNDIEEATVSDKHQASKGDKP